jgi:hypothetical protein
MKKRFILPVLAVVLTPVFGSGLLAGCAAFSGASGSGPDGQERAVRTDLWGSPAPAVAATKTIIVTPELKFVNLIGGDVVRFVVGDQSFTWSFDGVYFPAAVDMAKVSNGLLQRPLIAYVEANPMYQRDPG